MINIFLKDLKLFISDKKTLASIILMPIILTTILSFALSGSFAQAGSDWKLNIGVVKEYNFNLEKSKFTEYMVDFADRYDVDIEKFKGEEDQFSEFNPEKIFFEDYLENKEIKTFLRYEIISKKDGLEKLENKEISSLVILPKNYIYDMNINTFTNFRNKVEIEVISHPDMNYSGSITKELIKNFNDIMSSIIISKNVYFQATSPYLDIEEIGENMPVILNSNEYKNGEINIEERTIDSKNYISSFAYYTVAMLAMFVLFVSSYGGKFILDEKRNNTFQRQIASGKPLNQILLGKFLMMAAMVLIQSSVMIILSSFVFKINWINLPQIILITILSSLMVASLGLMITAITLKTNNYKVSDAFSSGVVQILALFGGSYIPLEIMPKFIGAVGKYTPNGAVLKAYIKTLEGYGILNISEHILVLAANIIIFLIISTIIIRRKSDAEFIKS
ncbi:MAG: ABC transporter permease [Bacillota bacterium]|nr:ABC transporter permease [Bacillota bacterium]